MTRAIGQTFHLSLSTYQGQPTGSFVPGEKIGEEREKR
jgi:hypothetical protein